MSTMPTDNRSFLQRWRQFWFAPGDPTTLGFIRIATGLLVLYTHLAYSLDLQAFFGKFGWYSHAAMERERKDQPNYVGNFWDWDESGDAEAAIPEPPLRKAAVMRFIRSLPASSGERKNQLAYLNRVSEERNLFLARLELNVARRLYSVRETQRELMLRNGLEAGTQWYEVNGGEFVDKKPEDAKFEIVFPELFLTAPPEERVRIANELRSLLPALPKNATDAQYLLAHLDEMGPPYRKAFVQFLVTLPDDATERGKLVDYLEYWHGDRRRADHLGVNVVSIWFHVTDPAAMNAVHGTILLIIVLFTLGVCTRVTSVLVWLAAMGYLHRTNQVLFGMDTMMNILLIYLMIGNSGAALSVDRLVARYRAARASIRRCGTIDEPTRAFLAGAPLSTGANLGVRLIQVHFCFIYMAAGLSKLKGDGWWNGAAFWDVMISPEFTLMKYQWFEEFVRKIASIKPLYHTITMFGVWFTWGLEISFPFLVWTRLRPLMVWMGVLLHAGIGMLMGLNVFELYMMTMLLVFFPPGVIRDRLRGSGEPKVGYGFDPAKPEQARAAAVVAAVDVDGQVNFDTKKTVAPPAKELFGTLRLLGMFGWLMWIPGVSGLVSRAVSPPPK